MTGGILEIFTIDLALAASVVAASGIIRGFTGFGGGLLMAPLLTVLFGPVEAFAVFSTVASVSYIPLYQRAVRLAYWPELAPLLAGIVVATPAGVALLIVSDPDLVRRAIGVAVIFGAVLMLTGWVYGGPRRIAASVVVGAICGGVNGFAGVGGPPMVIYFLGTPVGTETQRANILITTGLVSMMILASVAIGGGVSGATMARAAVLLPASLFGTWAGVRLFAAAPGESYRPVVAWLLVAIGLGVIVI